MAGGLVLLIHANTFYGSQNMSRSRLLQSRCWWAIAAGWLILCQGLPGQAGAGRPTGRNQPAALPAADQPFRVEVEALLLEVGVTGRNGRPVPGLQAEDFRVMLGKNLQTVQRCLWVSEGRTQAASVPLPPGGPVAASPAPAVKAGAEAAVPAADQAGAVTPGQGAAPVRRIMFVVDDLWMPHSEMIHTRKLLDRYVRTYFQPGDRAGLWTTSAAPDAVIAPAATMADWRNRLPSLLLHNRAWQLTNADRQSSVPFAGAMGDPDGQGQARRSDSSSAMASAAKQNRSKILLQHTIQLTTTCLGAALDALRGQPGYRAVILLCSGMEISKERPGQFREVAAAAKWQGIGIYSIDMRNSLPDLIPAEVGSDNLASFVLFTKDFENTRPPSVSPGVYDPSGAEEWGQLSSEDMMDWLAGQTGGLAFRGSDWQAGLDRVMRDMDAYYLLVVSPRFPDGKKRSAQKLSVALPGHAELEVALKRKFIRLNTGDRK